nr:MAG TPA: hypothetical protein [Bacteriophage sp.]DAW21879.1 MAG TPA: hypothetical protein [Bacteriophage sp.]DAW87495.1 MAG TPA: hypothetical protein [Bacteriophage sp.]
MVFVLNHTRLYHKEELWLNPLSLYLVVEK